jgi:hypothetical protein
MQIPKPYGYFGKQGKTTKNQIPNYGNTDLVFS